MMSLYVYIHVYIICTWVVLYIRVRFGDPFLNGAALQWIPKTGPKLGNYPHMYVNLCTQRFGCASLDRPSRLPCGLPEGFFLVFPTPLKAASEGVVAVEQGSPKCLNEGSQDSRGSSSGFRDFGLRATGFQRVSVRTDDSECRAWGNLGVREPLNPKP